MVKYVDMPVLQSNVFDAIVFDIGGVFGIRNPTSMVPLMATAGIAVSANPDDYRRAHSSAARHLAGFEAGSGNVEKDPEFWGKFDRHFLERIGAAISNLDLAHQTLLSPPEGVSAARWDLLLEENIAGFQRISKRFPVAIVSNNDGTAAEQMRAFGVCQVGDGPFVNVAAIIDSTIVGVAKPDPAIFTPVLRALQTDPARTLYVGDTVHADIRGATAAGMPAVQLDPYDLYDGFDHFTIRDVIALADHLGC